MAFKHDDTGNYIKTSLVGFIVFICLVVIGVGVVSLKPKLLDAPSSQTVSKSLFIDNQAVSQFLSYVSDIPQLISDSMWAMGEGDGAKLAVANNIPTNSKANNIINLHTPILTKQLRAKGLKFGSPVLIRVFKVPSILEVWIKKDKRFVLFKTYAICRFSGRLGPKTKTGDKQSPEGFYTVYPRQLNPNSSYFLSFNLGYPNAYDRHYNRTGSALMIHGECASVGCYAMTNGRMSEIYTLMYSAFANGQASIQIQAYPFALTTNNMKKMKTHSWYSFWANLKVGYDAFERSHDQLPVSVVNGRYQFTP